MAQRTQLKYLKDLPDRIIVGAVRRPEAPNAFWRLIQLNFGPIARGARTRGAAFELDRLHLWLEMPGGALDGVRNPNSGSLEFRGPRWLESSLKELSDKG